MIGAYIAGGYVAGRMRTRWHETGDEAEFRDGVLSGIWRTYDSKNRKMSEWTFEEGRRTGKSTWFYPSGQKHREVDYRDEARLGDHICYISDLRRLQADYPGWSVTRGLDGILDELAEAVRQGAAGPAGKPAR